MTKRYSTVSLPIEPILPELREALVKHHGVVLSADPGAGKTTRVPLVLLQDSWFAGKRMIMLEPRRLAARRAAAFMAEQIGEEPGETIGYRIRGDTRVGNTTRIEVVTEGVLTRMLQSDPAATGVALVIFDEFHERSIHADFGLALTLEVQAHLRDDLRILVMSATLDGLAVASLLGDAPVLKSKGAMFPVTTHYLNRAHDGSVEALVVSTVVSALQKETGDLLVFLPGQREIRRVESQLARSDLPPEVTVHMLFSDAPFDRQKAALAAPPSGQRKVILSTSVAETSLTIDGVRVVIDSGLARTTRFDPRRGMSGLVTVPVSQASADQRRGRAGRQGPGACYRLWTQQQHSQLPLFSQPEIVNADLASLALELACWGEPEARGLKFLDPLPIAHLSQARGLLKDLGALDERGGLSNHGRAMSELPVHPRLAHMLLRGKELGLGSLACDVAALLEEGDLLRRESGADIDLHSRWHVLRKVTGGDRFARERVLAQAARLRGLLKVPDRRLPEDKLGLLLALAYPERVAKQREARSGRYQLAGGTGAVLPTGSFLAREQYLAVGEADGVGSEARVYLAAPLSEEDIYGGFSDRISTSDEVYWDPRQHTVIARRATRLGNLRLSEVPLKPSKETLRATVCEGIRQLGLDALPWSKDALSMRTRSEWLRSRGLVGEGWPDLSDRRLLDALPQWLGPHLDGVTRRAHLQRLDLARIIRGLFSFEQLRRLDHLAPTHCTVATGSRIPLDYGSGPEPVLAVRLQEMFGETDTPALAGGKVKVLLHLLSPARRPLAVTSDLRSFWKNAYPEVRKDMRGRYPKHFWPENPLEAAPTRRVKRKLARP